MAAPDQNVVRLLTVGEVDRLLHLTPLATRVFLALFWGEDSERAGLSRCRPGLLADVLGSSRRACVAALDELQGAGLIRWSQTESIAVRSNYAERFWPSDRNNSVHWTRAIEALPTGLIRTELLEIAKTKRQAATEAASQAATEAASQAATEAASQGSPEVLKSVSRSLPDPKETLSAASGAPPATPPPSLPAVPAQGVLTMPTPRPAREPPPRVQAALLAQTAWNSIMAPPNAKASRLDGADITVVGNAVEYVGGIEAMRALMAWAITDDWFGGRTTTNPWTIRSWCARGTLDAAQAKQARGPAQPHRPAPKFGSVQHMDQLVQDYRAKQPAQPVVAPDDGTIPF